VVFDNWFDPIENAVRERVRLAKRSLRRPSPAQRRAAAATVPPAAIRAHSATLQKIVNLLKPKRILRKGHPLDD